MLESTRFFATLAQLASLKDQGVGLSVLLTIP